MLALSRHPWDGVGRAAYLWWRLQRKAKVNTKRLRLVLLAIPLVAVAALTVAADRSHPDAGVVDPTCVSSGPCIEYDNNSTGPGVRGVSLLGNGLVGWTKHNSTSAANASFG